MNYQSRFSCYLNMSDNEIGQFSVTNDLAEELVTTFVQDYPVHI